MDFWNVYIQFYILHITYNQWRNLPLPFGGAEEVKINFKEIINFIWENEFLTNLYAVFEHPIAGKLKN